jgi:FlaA1/EpsC-like NDP-sugar epimerase
VIPATAAGVFREPRAIAWKQMRARARSLVYTRTTQLLIDGIVVALALVAAYFVRFDGDVPAVYANQLAAMLPGVVVVYLAMNHVWGVYRFVWHFIGPETAKSVAWSVASAALAAFALNIVSAASMGSMRMPLGISILHPLFVYTGWMSMRVLRRFVYGRERSRREAGPVAPALAPHARQPRRRVLLAGAADSGLPLLHELRDNPGVDVVGCLEDSPELRDRLIDGCPVLGTIADLELLAADFQINEIVLCNPTSVQAITPTLSARCKRIGIRLSTIPTLSDIVRGKVSMTRLRPVQMEDLLGRASASLEPGEDVIAQYRGRRVLVTGAAGSIGSELSRQLRLYEPSALILLDKDENGLHEAALELGEVGVPLVPIVASIREQARMRRIFDRWRPDVVFHAAAYKHVPLMEEHPQEAILNNVIGTRNVATLAGEYGAGRFVLISSDKAVRPHSIMGASKRVAELIVQAEMGRSTTRYCAVRFGNVLGSRASVVPIFLRQIQLGKSITVTHPSVQRYFMTIPEAVRLVIQAGALGRSGEIFFLDMGDPVNIADLARRLIELSGLVPDREIKIEFTGLRPGEKLNEELVGDDEEAVTETRYPGIRVVGTSARRPRVTYRDLDQLEAAALADDSDGIIRVLRDLNIGYHHRDHVAGPAGGHQSLRRTHAWAASGDQLEVVNNA